MSDKYIVLTVSGAAAAAAQLAKSVARGEVADEELPQLVQAARLQSGEIDPHAVTMVEGLAKQLQALHRALATAQRREAIPAVVVAAFPVSQDQLPEASVEALYSALSRAMPSGGGIQQRIRGAKQNADGSVDVLLASVHFMETQIPKDATHYLVTVAANGEASAPREVRVLSQD